MSLETMKYIQLIVVLAIVPLFVYAESNNLHQSTTTPLDARYEIVQSELAAKWTFRLDRFTGRVHQLLKGSDRGSTWGALEVVGLESIEANKPRFSIFTSGLASRHTFLMDTLTGKLGYSPPECFMMNIIHRISMRNILETRQYLISREMQSKEIYHQEQQPSLCENGLTFTYLNLKKIGSLQGRARKLEKSNR